LTTQFWFHLGKVSLEIDCQIRHLNNYQSRKQKTSFILKTAKLILFHTKKRLCFLDNTILVSLRQS